MSKTYLLNCTPNAGNFQEYSYETEWLECCWKHVHKTVHLVTAFYYPWLKVNFE